MSPADFAAVMGNGNNRNGFGGFDAVPINASGCPEWL